MGGYLVAFNSGAEQLQVEQYFKLEAKTLTSAQTWIGVVLSNYKYFLTDGTFLGQGLPSDSGPYAHWCVWRSRVHSVGLCPVGVRSVGAPHRARTLRTPHKWAGVSRQYMPRRSCYSTPRFMPA